jgi:anti-sigma B factor antagonist
MAQEPDLQTAPVPLTLQRSGSGENPVVEAAGEIDVATSPLLRAELATLLEQRPESITVDLAAVSFIDSSGLGVLVGALKGLRDHNPAADMRVLHPQDAVRKVFDITGLDDLFDLQA